MPYKKRKKKRGKKTCYVVSGPEGKRHAVCTTKRKADAQMRLLRAIEYTHSSSDK